MTQGPSDFIYQAGSCNIGKEEVRRRFRIGYIGTAITIFIILLIALFHLPSSFRWAILPPAYYAWSGYLQAYGKFCYIYGWKGVTSMMGKKQFQRIKEDAFLKKDRSRAIRYVVICFTGALLMTLLYVYFL